ncbi:hypothetical protein ACIRS1_24935 [Kitasatospora sp. NPDC101176]|uniref:hypothetical protein n=1 Tax=Kitasatospora sp. NPDC101176 TaxID=3364099 RepID=UPI003830B326
MPSRISGRRRAGLAGFAGLVLTVGLALTGCDPSATDGTTAPPSPKAAVTTATTPPAVPTTPPAAPTSPAAVPPVAPPTSAAPTAPDPAPTRTAAPPSAVPSVHASAPAPKAPQPKVTTAQPPTDPEPQQTSAAGATGCEIRSNAGNCYAAGQFCREADLGRSTHDANGRMIYCRMVSGKPHWQA